MVSLDKDAILVYQLHLHVLQHASQAAIWLPHEVAVVGVELVVLPKVSDPGDIKAPGLHPGFRREHAQGP